MALPVDDASIQKAVKFEPYKSFGQVVGEEKKLASAKEFRVKFNSLGLTDSEEKDWVKVVTATLQSTKKKDVSEILEWAVDLRKLLNNSAHNQVIDFIKKFGGGAVELVKAFGAKANPVQVQTVVKILGPDWNNWIKNIPENLGALDVVHKSLTALQSIQFTEQEIRDFWKHFDGMDKAALWGLMEESPKWLQMAHQHLPLIADPAKFWMKAVAGDQKKQLLGRVGEIVYADQSWNSKSQEVNALGSGLLLAIDKPWATLFGIAGLLKIAESLPVKEVRSEFLKKAGDLSLGHPQGENTGKFGKWLSDHCDLVSELTRNGYTDLAIVAMFKKGFKKWEILSCTWFPRQPVAFSNHDTLLVKVENVNGGLIGRRSHLAQRHLYLHFDFTDVKAANSFHPLGTTIPDMVKVANGLKLLNRNAGLHTAGKYCVCVGEENTRGNQRPNPEKNLVISLYPDIETSDINYFTSKQLEAIKEVLQFVPAGNKALPWR